MNTIIRKFLGLLLLFSLIAAHVFTGAGKAHASWEAKWKRTVDAAKKEGQVTIYTSSRQNNLLLEQGAFQKSFPEIKLLVSEIRSTAFLPNEELRNTLRMSRSPVHALFGDSIEPRS